MAAILAAHPAPTGTVFDLEPTAAMAREFLASRGLGDRCDALGGDFLAEVPRGYEAYILKSILHDWDDAKATAILKTCRQAIPRDGRLLIIEEVVIPRQSVGNPHRVIDLEMLVHFGGKERTEVKFRALMTQAGFSLMGEAERHRPFVRDLVAHHGRTDPMGLGQYLETWNDD